MVAVATNKLAAKLEAYRVGEPDAEWGNYVLLRPLDERLFLASLRRAENTPIDQLNPDGNRAVSYCSTTDAYQVIHHEDPARQQQLQEHLRFVVRRSLELIRDHSTINVRILTRSPLGRADFDLFRSFGKRRVFGMSLPTLRNDLAKVYETKAPAPSRRLATLRAAKAAGGPVHGKPLPHRNPKTTVIIDYVESFDGHKPGHGGGGRGGECTPNTLHAGNQIGHYELIGGVWADADAGTPEVDPQLDFVVDLRAFPPGSQTAIEAAFAL